MRTPPRHLAAEKRVWWILITFSFVVIVKTDDVKVDWKLNFSGEAFSYWSSNLTF